jgi:peptidoglycan/LPS O-acetylase OafA/YrhL
MILLFLIARAAMFVLPSAVFLEHPIPLALGLFLLSSAAASLLGWLSYRHVESPAIAFSKELCRRIKCRRAATKCISLPEAPVESLTKCDRKTSVDPSV